MPTCPYCSTPTEPAWTFCVECGSAIVKPEPNPIVSIDDEGTISVRVTNVTEAKIGKLELKAKKKEYALEKRSIMDQERIIRADYTHHVRTRMPKMRGGGTFAKIIRTAQSASHTATRAELARKLAPFEARRRVVDRIMANIDLALLKVDQYLLERKGGQ